MRTRVLLLAALLLLPTIAAARSNRNLTYSYDAIWTTAVRLIRADRGYRITDRDKESGYVLFVYPGTGSVKECPASLQLVSTVDENGHEVVRLELDIAHQPSYVEVDLLDRLEVKLREERGAPPAPRRREPGKPDAPPPQRRPSDGPEGKRPAPDAPR